jgi:hypothetical protein
MNDDDVESFERKLRAQPVKRIPGEWREQILATAKREGESASRTDERLSSAPGSRRWAALSDFLWPSPRVWAGLAAVWLALLMVNGSLANKPMNTTKGTIRPASEMLGNFQEQERLLAELLAKDESPQLAFQNGKE